jgi:hypothetical protein
VALRAVLVRPAALATLNLSARRPTARAVVAADSALRRLLALVEQVDRMAEAVAEAEHPKMGLILEPAVLAVEDIALSSVTDYAVIVNGVIDNVVRWNGDSSAWSPSEGYAIPLVDAIAQGIPRKSTPQSTVISAADFVQRIQSAAPSLIPRIWSSDHPAAAIAATALFTLSGEVDVRLGGRLQQLLTSLKEAGLLSDDEMNAILPRESNLGT